MFKFILLTILISFAVFVASQECNPEVVEWRTHQYSCEKFILCFHGNPLEKPCAPGLHFSPSILKCMLPADAQCEVNYQCPAVDDKLNPVYLPDRFDCSRYYVCFNGSPVQRSCAEGLWFDVIDNWCTTSDEVTCDGRTPNNPRPPTDTTVEISTTTQVPREPPVLNACLVVDHLYSYETGAYLKSSCVINRNENFDGGERNCQDRNMELFVISDAMVEETYHDAITRSKSAYVNGRVSISGRRNEEEEWFTSGPNPIPLYNGIEWVQTESVDGRVTGDCLWYSSQHGPYRALGANCNTVVWSGCEFSAPPVLNTDICNNHTLLFDAAGNYQKTACFVATSSTYHNAHQICNNNGMKLFVTNSSSVQSTLQIAISNFISSGFFWINGRRDATTEEWFSYGHGRSAIYEGMDWVATDTVDGRNTGDCLTYSTQHGSSFQALGVDCSRTFWMICEF